MSIEAMKQALEALRFALHVGFDESSESQIKKGDKAVRQHENVIAALRERLAQPEQEPVACPDGKQCKHGAWCTETYCQEHCEFRAPPQRQPLTEEQIDDIWNRYCDEMGEASINDAYDIARAIEAAHGIKEKNT